jgi:hypothetical protein
MNRHERRAAIKRGDVIFIDYGNLLERDQNYGLSVVCYVCATPHNASGLARITDKSGLEHVALCQSCLQSARDDGVTKERVYRKFLNAPDLEISEGGVATTEQVMALAEKQGVTAH